MCVALAGGPVRKSVEFWKNTPNIGSCPFHTGLKMKRLELFPHQFLCLYAHVDALRDSSDHFILLFLMFIDYPDIYFLIQKTP